MKRRILFAWAIVLNCLCLSVVAQNTVEDLMKEQDKLDQEKTVSVSSTFESTRLIYGHSTESSKAGNLDFRISHRFGATDQGFYDWFGLDNANIRLGLDYGITDRFMVGAGRSSLNKEYDFYGKYKFLEQTNGQKTMPINLSFMAELMVNTLKSPEGVSTPSEERLSTACQFLVSRKFSDRFSAQLIPTWIHSVKTMTQGEPNDIFSVGLGGSFKLSNRIRLNLEYYPLFGDNRLTGTVPPVSVGIDMQTGGHVFQLFIGNAVGTNERQFITQTMDKWSEGQLHLGFNILRVFSVKKKHVN